MLILLIQLHSKCVVLGGSRQMQFSEEHLIICYIQLRSFCEEKSHFISHHLLRKKKKINQYEKKSKFEKQDQCLLRKASFVY